MCNVLLPPGDYPIAVNKYIISYKAPDNEQCSGIIITSKIHSVPFCTWLDYHFPNHKSIHKMKDAYPDHAYLASPNHDVSIEDVSFGVTTTSFPLL
jgi:hypothetical protein